MINLVFYSTKRGYKVTSDTLKKYIDVVINVGLNLQKDQNLIITCGVDNYDFALAAAEAAYEKGARFVEINVAGTKLKKLRVKHSNRENLSYIPNFYTARSIEQVAEDWANLRIDYTEENDLLADEDITKVEAVTNAERAAVKLLSNELISFKRKWCIIAAPGRKWANDIFGSDNTEENFKKLNNALTKIMRLDSNDPVKVWQEHGKNLSNRAAKLKDFKFDKINITGGGTDLEIGMIPGVSWKGGYNETNTGAAFIPNLPTEEIFTTPDYTRTNGKAVVTRPVKVLEKTVTGAWFEFKEGKVINFGADKNRDALETFLNVDEGSRYLGESALVDSSSPIFQSGLVFNSILYDENAACHIAIGKGFASLLPNSNILTNETAIKENKCNVSLVHTDFMIGHQNINVTGTNNMGQTIDIIKNGTFTI